MGHSPALSISLLFPVAALCASIDTNSSARAYPVGCSSDACPAGKDGYRDGRCAACDCCPACWTCVELIHYPCAERLGITLREVDADLGTLAVGRNVSWKLDAATTGGASGATWGGSAAAGAGAGVGAGWHQCASFPSLPIGLVFTDRGEVLGAPRYDSARPEQYRGRFYAYRTVGFAGADSASEVLRMELHFTVVGNVPPVGFDHQAEARADERADGAARAAASAAYQGYEAFQAGSMPPSVAKQQLMRGLNELRGVLDARPRVGEGEMWAWLGALHMNAHKLLENVLWECEHFLGYALGFDDSGGGGAGGRSKAPQLARDNLDGCYAKRQLEAAKWLWMGAMQDIISVASVGESSAAESDSMWAAVEDKLARAAKMKDGWGWGVNNGDIWISLAAVQAVRATGYGTTSAGAEPGADTGEDAGAGAGAGADADADAAQRRDALLATAEATLELAHDRNPHHPWTQETRAALASLRQAANAGPTAVHAQRASLVAATVHWCEQVLEAVRPAPRSGPIPPLPRMGVGNNTGAPPATHSAPPQSIQHPRDALFADLGLDMGVPPVVEAVTMTVPQ